MLALGKEPAALGSLSIQKRAHTFYVRSFPTPALAEEPAKSLGRWEHPCGMSCSKKYCKDVSECFANSAAVVQCVYPTTANNQEVLEYEFTEVCKGSGLPWVLRVFWFWGWFCFALPTSGAISWSNDRWWQAALPTHLPNEAASSLSHFKGLNSITRNLMMWLEPNFYSWRAAIKSISLKFVLAVVGSRFSPHRRWLNLFSVVGKMHLTPSWTFPMEN